MIKTKIIQVLESLESTVLLGRRYRLLMLLASYLSVSSVFAVSINDQPFFEEQQQAQKQEQEQEQRDLARTLQAKKINRPNNIMGYGQNIIESNTSKSPVRNEKTFSTTPNNNATGNESSSNKNIVSNVGSIKNTPKDVKTDEDILSPLDANENGNENKNNKITPGGSSTNSNVVVTATTTAAATEEGKNHPNQHQETTNVQTGTEVKLKDETADVPVPISNNSEKAASDKNDKNKGSVKSESDNEAEKLAVTAKPAEQEKQEKRKKQKTSAIGKVKSKTKRQTAKKSQAESVQNEEDESYTSESFSQGLKHTLSSDRLAGKTGVLFAENEQIRVNLSNRDINRLSVTDDKIQSINGPAGFYTAKNDLLGSAYIGISTNKNFTLFASTLKGHQFSLLVAPIASAGKTIVLTPSMPSRMTAQREAAEGYQRIIVSLISSMINNEPLQDYAYVPAKRPKAYNFYGIAQIKPIGYYLGANLIGSVSVIKNTTGKPLSIKPSIFYTRGIRAAALSEQTLAPKASGLLYQIISR